jgi:uncharacterized protein (DUF1499 family)
LTRPAGFLTRLLTALTENVAETASDSAFPELRIPPTGTPPDELYEEVRQAIRHLGWQIRRDDPRSYQLEAIATSRFFRFKDDVTVRLGRHESGATILFVRSASRVGIGDLGANRRRIATLLETLSASGVPGG